MSGWRRDAPWLAIAILVAAVASVLEPMSDAGALASILVQLLLDGVAFWFLARAARRSAGRMRAAWGFLALGPGLAILVIVAALAELLLFGTQVLGTAIIPPLLAVNTVAVIAGLVLLSPPQVRGGTAVRFALDAVIASLSVFFLLWASLDVRQSALGEAPAETVLIALYPATDAAAAMVVLLALGFARWKVPEWYQLVAASAGVVLLGDVLAAGIEVAGSPDTASVAADTGFLASLALLALAARRFDGWPPAERQERFSAQWLPYLPFGLAIAAAGYDYWENDGLAPDLFLLAVLAVAGVLARTILLLNENHRLARRLQASDRFKTQLLRFISHEIGNPLSPLRLQASLLNDGKHGWAIVERSIGRLESLSRDVRMMALAETQRLVQPARPDDVAARVRAAVQAYGPVAAKAGITLTGPPAPLRLVQPIDGERFDQVVDNLLSNAVKFTPTGGTVHVGLDASPDGCELTVRDSGAGLTEAQAHGLFTAFGRQHGDTQPGLGLGLYLCKAIVEGHGGRIWADSPGPGLGATFHVTLPRAPPVPETGQLPQAPRYEDGDGAGAPKA